MQIPIIPFGGKNKPWNSIPQINLAHPLARGLIFYGYDTGTGCLIDLVEGLRPLAATNPRTAPFYLGAGLKYASGGAQIKFPISTPINNSFVSSRYSIATAWYINSLTSISWTCPFGVNDASSGSASSILWDAANNLDMQWTLANTNVTTFSTNTINQYHSVVGTNTSATAQNVYFDGALKSTSAVTSTFSTSTMFACFNTAVPGGATVAGGIDGWVPYGALWNRTITAPEAFLLHNDPYCFLSYPEDDMRATWVGAAATPTTSEDQWHQGWSSVGRRYAIIGAG